MKCHFEIFKDQKLIITYYNGIIELDDIKGNMIELNKHPDYSANYNVINDFSRCVLNINYEEVTFYINFLKNDLGIIAFRKVAFVTDAVNEVVVSMIFCFQSSELPIISKTFSEFDAALFWIGIYDMKLFPKFQRRDLIKKQ